MEVGNLSLMTVMHQAGIYLQRFQSNLRLRIIFWSRVTYISKSGESWFGLVIKTMLGAKHRAKYWHIIGWRLRQGHIRHCQFPTAHLWFCGLLITIV